MGLCRRQPSRQVARATTETTRTISANLGANNTREFGTALLPIEAQSKFVVGAIAVPTVDSVQGDFFFGVNYKPNGDARVHIYNASGTAIPVATLNTLTVEVMWVWLEE